MTQFSMAGKLTDRRVSGRLLRSFTVVSLLVLAAVVGFTAPVLASSPPSIESESATNISSTNATLVAVIDPNGLETGYEFQIDTDGSYDYTQPVCPQLLPAEITCDSIIDGSEPPVREPQPEQIVAGLGGQIVSLDLSSVGTTLQPGITYHYRVIAANGGSPTVQGPDQIFTTPPGAPAIDSESVSGVTVSAATIAAEIDLGGLETTYEFWLAYPDCPNTPPDGDGCGSVSEERVGLGQVAAGDSDQAVSVDLSGLQSDHSYSYWVLASNSAGRTEGPHQIFGTPAAYVPEPASFGGPSSTALSGGGNLPSAYTPVVKPSKKTIKCAKNQKLSHGKCIRRKKKKARKAIRKAR